MVRSFTGLFEKKIVKSFCYHRGRLSPEAGNEEIDWGVSDINSNGEQRGKAPEVPVWGFLIREVKFSRAVFLGEALSFIWFFDVGFFFVFNEPRRRPIVGPKRAANGKDKCKNYQCS
jgi:hypothetical protein